MLIIFIQIIFIKEEYLRLICLQTISSPLKHSLTHTHTSQLRKHFSFFLFLLLARANLEWEMCCWLCENDSCLCSKLVDDTTINNNRSKIVINFSKNKKINKVIRFWEATKKREQIYKMNDGSTLSIAIYWFILKNNSQW